MNDAAQPADGDQNGPGADHALKSLEQLHSEIVELQQQVRSLTGRADGRDPRVEITLALLNDANGWARHFSNTRLVIAIVQSVVCLGVPLSRWEDPWAVFVWLTLAIWLLGTSLFVILSLEEWRKLDQRRRNVRELRRLLGEEARPLEQPVPYRGATRILMEWIRQRDWAYAASLALTGVQLVAWVIWVA